jgi:hypothetical protein
MKRIAWCLAFAVGLAAARPLAAGTYHWTGAEDGFWTNANNWAEGKVPGRYETPAGRMGAAGDTAVFGDALKGKAATTIDFDERLAKELAFAAERSDIAEEITRLDSHLDQFGDALGKPEAVGRMLDFLCQEMAREINTLSAKTADTAISSRALVLKAEVERIREQVQNVE